MNLRKILEKNFFLVLSIFILFISGLFISIKKYNSFKMNHGTDYILCKKSIDYGSKKSLKYFFKNNKNVYGILSLFKLLQKDLKKEDVIFLIKVCNNLSFFQDQILKNILYFDVARLQLQMNYTKDIFFILNKIKGNPWEKYSDIWKKNLSKIDLNKKYTFVYKNGIPFLRNIEI
ncbi:MAG: hypothetical protein G8D24_01945 [Buchnera aphidicola (Periphyllus lyropictus)]|uniref:hypothetical protein n=1 Tax=Buchnera aphidicola TaxID=9 RepID=UPI001EC5BAB9|nr:hypothetical protein [Buchnera aphidicola]NIH16805.1 hypothetical protein [Buchnera aphidicola (Periphyllus lyropictus)]USS94701.1 hypothetical protein M5J13_00540 [Buchnera aphidicola (Periphyllus lyropictus)]